MGRSPKLDRFDLLIFNDVSYARRDQAETSVLFELIAERYERKSIAPTAKAPFSACNKVFPDKAKTVAAVDRTPITFRSTSRKRSSVGPVWCCRARR